MDPINRIPILGNLQRNSDYVMTPVHSHLGDEIEVFAHKDLYKDPGTAHDVWSMVAIGVVNHCSEESIWENAERIWVGVCTFFPFVGKEGPNTVNIDPHTFTQWAPVMIVLKFDGTEHRWAYDMDNQQMVAPWFNLATGEMNA